ncbi:MAG: hypothetical protein JWP85_1491 [Rhodoglobus sp.]|nr:hypothetical protein [Rhodoglobus sp.]
MRYLRAGAAAVAGIALVAASFTIEAAVPGEPSVRFTASGDFSSTPESFSVFNAIGTIDQDLHLALGDLSYSTTGNEQTWCDLVTTRVGAGFPFELVSGNHESNGENGNINDFSACLPNQLPGLIGTYGRQYYVDVPAGAPLVRYIMISPALTFPDGTWSYAAGTPRYNWTAAAIDGARSSNIPWVVVGMHKPCLSMGAYNCDPGSALINLLVSKKVDLVLHGHEHLYQRTHQLSQSGACSTIVPGTFTAACIADSDGTMVKGAGTVFATVGTGGVPFRDINTSDTEAGYFAKYSALNANPTWGSLDVTVTATELSASFARASGGTFTDTFSIGPAGPTTNTPPTAAFTSSVAGLTASFDGSTSTDPDGTIAGYAWNFGDSTTGSGATTSHAYATGGTYTATLTVTDNQGATGSVSHPVTVTAPPAAELARDDFNRTVASGWGTAPTGGAWTIAGTATALKVADGTGQVTLPPGSTRTATLSAVSSSSTDSTITFSLGSVPTGGGSYSTLIGRQSGAANYSASAWIKSTGAVALVVKQGATVLASPTISGLTYTAGTELRLRLQVTGASPTSIRAKLWVASQAEPATWQATLTDATASLQVPGSVGVQAYLSSTATQPMVSKFDNFLVVPAP